MNAKGLKLSGLLIAAAVLLIVLAAACGGGEPQELEIPVRVEGEKMTPETIKVKQDDMVTLKIQSDDAIEFHLHTYDIEMEVEPGTVTDLFFVADATGRFRITFHHVDEEEEATHEETEEQEEIDIGFLEVQPR